MNRAMLFIVIIVMGLSEPLQAQAGEPIAGSIVETVPAEVKTAGSTVEIIRQTDGHLGAGVQIKPGLILTAAHLVSSDRTVIVKDDMGREQVGTVEDINASNDLAFVLVSVPSHMRVSPLSCRTPPIGLPIEMIGHPFGREFVSMQATVVTGVRQVGRWPSLVIMNRNAFPGMSGGPVLTSDGSVVALIVASIGPEQSIVGPAGAVPGSVICPLIPHQQNQNRRPESES